VRYEVNYTMFLDRPSYGYNGYVLFVRRREIRDAFQSKETIIGILLDTSKVFDRVSHKELVRNYFPTIF
jgi:hypothetical protein